MKRIDPDGDSLLGAARRGATTFCLVAAAGLSLLVPLALLWNWAGGIALELQRQGPAMNPSPKATMFALTADLAFVAMLAVVLGGLGWIGLMTLRAVSPRGEAHE